jgi:hypothetical protein
MRTTLLTFIFVFFLYNFNAKRFNNAIKNELVKSSDAHGE